MYTSAMLEEFAFFTAAAMAIRDGLVTLQELRDYTAERSADPARDEIEH